MIIRDMVCMWCGHHEPKSRDSDMREHIRTCAKSEHVQRIGELEAQLAITQEAAKIDPSRRRADAAEARIAELELSRDAHASARVQLVAALDEANKTILAKSARIANLEAALKEIARGSVDTTMLNDESYLKFLALLEKK